MNNIDLEKTGQFLPVDEYIDLTNRGSLPDDPERGYRVLTKEALDYYGLFYDKNEMERIAELLEGTGWGIPTEEDWNDMLNSKIFQLIANVSKCCSSAYVVIEYDEQAVVCLCKFCL